MNKKILQIKKSLLHNENMELSILNKRDMLKYNNIVNFKISGNRIIPLKTGLPIYFSYVYNNEFYTIIINSSSVDNGINSRNLRDKNGYVFYDDIHDKISTSVTKPNNTIGVCSGIYFFPFSQNLIEKNDLFNISDCVILSKSDNISCDEDFLFDIKFSNITSYIAFVFDRKIKFAKFDALSLTEKFKNKVNQIFINDVLCFFGDKWLYSLLIIDSSEVKLDFFLKTDVLDFNLNDIYLYPTLGKSKYCVFDENIDVLNEFTNKKQINYSFIYSYLSSGFYKKFIDYFKINNFDWINPLLLSSIALSRKNSYELDFYCKSIYSKNKILNNINKEYTNALKSTTTEQRVLSHSFLSSFSGSRQVYSNYYDETLYEFTIPIGNTPLSTVFAYVINHKASENKYKIDKDTIKFYGDTTLKFFLPVISKEYTAILRVTYDNGTAEDITEDNGIFKSKVILATYGLVMVATIFKDSNTIVLHGSSNVKIKLAKIFYKANGFIFSDPLTSITFATNTSETVTTSYINLFDIIKEEKSLAMIKGMFLWREKDGNVGEIKIGNYSIKQENDSNRLFIFFNWYSILKSDEMFVSVYNENGFYCYGIFNILKGNINFYNETLNEPKGVNFNFSGGITLNHCYFQFPSSEEELGINGFKYHAKYIPTMENEEVKSIKYFNDIRGYRINSDKRYNTGSKLLYFGCNNNYTTKRFYVIKNYTNKIYKVINISISKSTETGTIDSVIKHNFNKKNIIIQKNIINDVTYFILKIKNSSINDNSYIDIVLNVPTFIVEDGDSSAEFLKSINIEVQNG